MKLITVFVLESAFSRFNWMPHHQECVPTSAWVKFWRDLMDVYILFILQHLCKWSMVWRDQIYEISNPLWISYFSFSYWTSDWQTKYWRCDKTSTEVVEYHRAGVVRVVTDFRTTWIQQVSIGGMETSDRATAMESGRYYHARLLGPVSEIVLDNLNLIHVRRWLWCLNCMRKEVCYCDKWREAVCKFGK